MLRNCENIQMNRFSVCFLFILCSWHCLAQTDVTFSTTLRSYPLTGVMEAQAGHSFLLWGEPKDANPLFGYVRPFASYHFIPGYMGANVGLDIFPVSFLGLRYVQEQGENNKDYLSYNCEIRHCRGSLKNNSLETFLALAWRDFFWVGRYKTGRREFSTDNSTHEEYVDSGLSAALLVGEVNLVKAQTMVLGYKWSERINTSYLYQAVFNDSDKRLSLLSSVNIQYKLNSLEVLFGVGRMESKLKEGATTLLFRLGWNYKEKLGLF